MIGLAALPRFAVDVDCSGETVSLLLTWQSKHYPALSDDVEVEVYRVARGWCAKGGTTVRGVRYWYSNRTFATRDAAATYAADVLNEAMRLALAWSNDEPLEDPLARMTRVADAMIGPNEADLRERARLRAEWKRCQDWRAYRDPRGMGPSNLIAALRGLGN
jgi:hypothetical protein